MNDRAGLAVVVAGCALAACMPEGAPLVTGHGDTYQVAVDGTHVYWSELGKVWRVPKAGGTEELVGTSTGVPISLASNGAWVAWLTVDQARQGTVTLRELAGSDQVVVATDIDQPRGLALDAEGVYWTAESDGSGAGGLDPGLVVAAPLDGGAPAPLVTGLRFPYGLQLAGDFVYVIHRDQVVRAPRRGGTPELVADLQTRVPHAFAVGDHVVFWHETDGKQLDPLAWAPLAGPPDARHELVVTAVERITLAARGDTLYFASPGAVWRMGTTDAEPTLLAASSQDLTQLRPGIRLRGFAIDEDRAFWASETGVGTVEAR